MGWDSRWEGRVGGRGTVGGRGQQEAGGRGKELNASAIFFVDLPDLIREIKQDHSKHPLNTLFYSEESNAVQYVCFKAAQPLQPMLSSFHHLAIQYPSELFQHVWKAQLKVVSGEKQALKIADVKTKVWDPVFQACCLLIDSVKSLTITLAAVNQDFRNLEDRQYHLELLFKAVEACFGRTVDSTTWIRAAIDRMCLYWSLCEQADAAKTVLELKDSLKLKGNFEVIESVAGAFTVSMGQQTLDSIDQKLVETSSFLKNFSKDRKKLESLKSFSACLDIVEWIRKESQGA